MYCFNTLTFDSRSSHLQFGTASSPGVAPFLSAVPIVQRGACGVVGLFWIGIVVGLFAIRSLPIKPRAPSSFYASATAPGDEAEFGIYLNRTVKTPTIAFI